MQSRAKLTAFEWIKKNQQNLSDWHQVIWKLPKNIEPPVHFRWPEYIDTARGQEWFIPTSDEDR